MKTREQELHELAAAIEENEGCESIAALAKAREMLAELQRAAHQWNHQAQLQGNPNAVDVKRN